MIKSVTVKNYILIDEITLDFNNGFNVFTGETGAGKSIIIGAIDSALGAKSSKEQIKAGKEKAIIELTIGIEKDFERTVFNENGIEIFDDELIISKEIMPSANRYRINGVMVTQDFIKNIREKLLDIHTQNKSYNYLQPKNHITLLDNFAPKSHKDNVILFKEKYHTFLNLQKKLDELNNLINTTQQQEDFLKFQIEEIENAQIEDINECEKLTKELDILSNVEKLKELSYSSYWALYGNDGNILSALSDIKSNISKLSRLDNDINPLEEDFINAFETLKEISNQLRNYADSKENDNERMDIICNRLSLLEKIKRKYGNSLENVLNTYEKLTNELNEISVSQDELINTEKEIRVLKTELDKLAITISNSRKEIAKTLSKSVTLELEKLELPKARFEIATEPCNINENGTDNVEFLISTNVSETLKPLAKTASGGEISRVMLTIKTIFAKADKTNTVIFDEIDTGISGIASQAVAESLINLSKTHQIILITHQPIIASKANTHFYVKKTQAEQTKVSVYNLQGENRIKAIALLSAGEINEESIAFARKLLNN